MTIWLTSDLHFGHANILDYTNRPWTTVEEMHEGMIQNWNARVGKFDTVYMIGDFAFRKDSARDAFPRLNGIKHLVIGNHDEHNKVVLTLPWESQTQIKVIKVDGNEIVMCHYPLLAWPGMNRGALHAHGHSHGNLMAERTRRMDVGIDCSPIHSPFNIEEFIAYTDVPLVPVDHHG